MGFFVKQHPGTAREDWGVLGGTLREAEESAPAQEFLVRGVVPVDLDDLADAHGLLVCDLRVEVGAQVTAEGEGAAEKTGGARVEKGNCEEKGVNVQLRAFQGLD